VDFCTADLCDKYDEKINVVAPIFKSFGGVSSFSGRIATCKLLDNNKKLIELLKSDGKERVCVVDVEAKFIAVVGDNLMALAKKNNWKGIIVNGYVRDTKITKNIEVGLLALGVCPKKAQAENFGELGCTLKFGGVKFFQDNYIYVDNDGVIVSKEPLYL